MMRQSIILISVLGLVSVCVGQIIQQGQCDPNIQLHSNFDIEQFLGTWKEYATTEHPRGGDCSTIDFTRVDNVITVYHKTVRQNFFEDYHGTATVETNTAKITLNLPQMSSNPIHFWVMNTDYANFALVYGCQNIGTTQRQVYIWQLIKENIIASEMMLALMNTTMNNVLGFNLNDLRVIEHSEVACYVLPVIEAGQPVILPGQCDTNITGVPNFNAAGFLGVWHQISNYHTENTLGTCARAQYSSQDGILVNVVNSQVINQTLLNIQGNATVISSDGSGKLNVVLEVTPGILAESELLVLGTDYNNWAITYTCINLANNQRRVYSWISSRSRTLSAQAQTEVNALVSSVLDLNNQYFQTTDQSNTGCFYVPEPSDDQVIFGGQCDQSILVQANFVAAQYLGLWHDIEIYPTPVHTGACNNAFYRPGQNGIDVLNTYVLNEQLGSTNGVGTFVGNEAKMVVNFTDPGTNSTTQTNYWIISTDYVSYSLVYSCRNINDYQQQISVWKQGRTRSLTPAANTAINNAMANLTIFDQRFFKAVDQTTEACFYYPEPNGQTVIFRGQCENVPVVTNFNVSSFQGTWYEIQTYPKEPQPGQCISHQFSPSGAAMSVVSNSVVDQLLGVTSGQLTATNGTNGSFNLTLNSNGTQTISFPYHIVATDYVNYALVYSCVNIDEDYRAIYSWKLSRTKQLAAVANTAIATAMQSVQTLSQEYFEDVYQTDDACFYFPDLALGEPVVLPGQCDNNIPYMTNFNVEAYTGRWRMIESYPSDNQIGACNQATYAPTGGNTFTVSNNEVANQELRQINGVGYAAQEGNQTIGKLIVTLPASADPFEMWVLDTDYSSYTIMYGCENINFELRRVYSWKMSRTTSLSAAANNAINAVIENVNVLNARYYYQVPQTDAACFYYPVPDGNPVVFRGQCDESIPVVMQFDPVGYMGLWHEIEKYPATFQNGTCANAFYTLDTEQGIVDVYNTQVIGQTLDYLNGYAVLDQVNASDTSAKLLVTFPVGGFNVTTSYWVLATDYTSYALVYSCTNLDSELRSVSSWKLSRTKSLSNAAITAMNNVINGTDVLDARYFVTQDQSTDGCFYFPEPRPGVPVVFPGQCDLNLTVVQNFNMSRFQGLWHEIEAYPKVDQPGQCINHEFTLNNSSSLNFQSSNVVQQILGITTGTASFTSTDNSAKLNLVFTSNGETITIPYWIVDTDYETYALAYSCVNQNSDFRGVWSWKLSRTKQLTAASSTAINNAIANIDVLDNVYYEPISQSDESCFYLPDLALGEPVIFPGQCEANIPVVQNFDVGRYIGRWRMIESYPSDNQIGACNQATYAPTGGNTFTVSNNEVANQELRQINGVGYAAQEGNQTIGKLIVTLPASAVPFEMWVLDTDYTSYTIMYGCENINSEQRRVYSWKMSRTTSLSAAANNAINAVIENVNVLNARYYYQVPQTDAACFYYPVPDGNPVVFRGQCDESIPVVMQFDPVGYMGLWHEIEKYPATFQNGTCANAFYTLDTEQGIVDVYNTQVIGQTLDYLNGYAVLDQVNASDTSAKLLVTFPVGGFNVTTSYWVLATDYTSYALVYSCTNLDSELRSVSSWKLSRTKSLSNAAITAMNNVINGTDVLDARYFVTQDQSTDGCFYFPEPRPGVPVVFPGQCDLNLTVVQNFNMSRFQGLWHEIEAYPKVDQPGQCINHEFTLNNSSSLNFQSSNVVQQILGITTGTASFTSTDNSAKLNLVFTSNGETITIPYWIVDTDYETYALAYSCVNQNSDFRGVWSWKLSRTKQLTAASSTAINNAIANIDVLDNVYYEPISQSDESCFYLPDLALGEPVIFPGQCEANIPVVQNFDVGRYIGRWRMIESYPSDNQIGACNQATYAPTGGNTFTVSNNEVANQELRQINGVGYAAQEGNQTIGKLIVTLPASAVPFEMWVLDTDYTSYTIMYGCENINSEQRRVYSWKMSRTTSLSAAANNAINAVIENVNVLNARYYYQVPQTDAACFYYPVPDGNPVVFRGQCDESIPVVMQFDPVGYMGLWHEIEKYPATFQNGTCANAFYTLDTEQGIVDVYNTQVIGQTLDYLNGYAVLDQVNASDTSAKLLVTFPVGGFNVTTSYWVLATDYTSYALVYSCTNLDSELRSVSSWKLSRTKSLSNAAITAMNNVINGTDVLDARYFVTQDQSTDGCFYFPEPRPGVPVVFPGQCDLNLTVVQNFNMSRFQGLWHEIEAYPKVDQPGQCINHEFTLNNSSSLNFQSSNVVQQILGITTGTASFTSTDNSAKLNLVFTSNGETITIPYWIVDTDYETYALAYSCVNQNSDFRGVWSWKLSRTKQLTAASSTAINNAIANIDVLDNVYYEPISQSDESCFYLPDLALGEPVIFPGQCEANIPVVQNFDVGRYTGRWRMIESYPSDNQIGACNQATYAPTGGNTFTVSNNEVANQELRQINGVGYAAQEGNQTIGKLIVTLPASAVPFEMWVLDTDYTSYTIMYGCENINSEQRRVYSWKMSRTTSLSAAANNAINAVIENVNVLNARYYYQVPQTDAACFYYPVPDGNPVVFRGQCDANITVVTGFDPTRYTGVWYDLERYPAAFQDGTCSTATYTLDPQTLVVDVVNTQVVNQVLDVQGGTAVLANTNGEAKLLVTFEVNGVNITTDYWVLATDYDNYALVYSCVNIDEENRLVNSWKLSRSKNFTAAAQTAFTAAINRVQVLEERYFEDSGHSEENCFFYPDNNGGDVVLEGQCVADSLVPAITGFNANLFSNTWHEVARFPSDLQKAECNNVEYSFGAQNSVTITKTEVNNEFLTATTLNGSLSNDGRGVINVNVSGVPFNTFYILDTDYNEYALLYSCRALNNTHKQVYSWKLSRSRNGLSSSANEKIDNLVSNNVDLFEGYYYYTDQTNNACFHYPEYDVLPAAIELIGPCDESIRGVPNFNAAAYLGTWIEIEKYPQGNQFGTCDRAYYSLGDGNVLVRNTQVIGDSLAEQLGYAEVASNDGSGLLNVTFVVNGVTVYANYYILATDYESYSFVYSCRNLDNGNRQVSSWKLSRTTSLSSQALTAINASIEQTQGLSPKWYLITGQSEEECFYIPEVNENAAPLFRGQCENVTGVANFNSQLFAGWWHEIERYPVDNNPGECTSSQYQVSGNGYQVVDTAVANRTGIVSSGTVEVSSDGRLRRTINGRTEDIWVLATDYETYALLYSCENVNSEYRRIWSAKHSKLRQLTQASQAAMQPFIESNRVLYSQFYLNVDQSDQACFHYPAVSGQQVILPGQCDDSIPVQQAFDVAAYGGTWYQIERYPQIHEDPTSTCIGARYVLDEATGLVTVLNWEVIDGVLETIEGTATLASTDGSAKLTVELPIVGTNDTVTTSLYVLETDYESYSLAYSCRNVNSFQRSIGAWKLSRERSMSLVGTAAIDRLIASRQELHQPYFQQVAHDEDCEEPSGGALVKSSIVVLMICALWQMLS